jgi:hypothetical protein
MDVEMICSNEFLEAFVASMDIHSQMVELFGWT